MIFLSALSLLMAPSSILIRGGLVVDGTGRLGRVEDVRVVGDHIVAIGLLKPLKDETVINAKGLVVAPGFIDAHSHASGGIDDDLAAETQVRQGITTAIVGQDGDSNFPIKNFFAKLEAHPATLNFASFVGHGTIREKVLGTEKVSPTAADREKMASLVETEMADGALGLSSGLEYVPGRYGDTQELVSCATAAAKFGGMYISHMRNEDNSFFEAFDELRTIGREGHLPAQVSHIKLGSARVWNRAGEVLRTIADDRKQGRDVTADVYPYTYWQSTIRVLIATEEFDDHGQWEQGLKDVGGPQNVRLTTYTPDQSWEGKTIAEIASLTGKDPITVIQGIIKTVHGPGGSGRESVVVTAMSEADLTQFIASPLTMFCTDGGLHPSHPRGAGSFPRILGHYVREAKALSLSEAIRKMTSYPAHRFGLQNRGVLKAGAFADVVIFDPKTVIDQATTAEPAKPPIGINRVMVNGSWVLVNGVVTDARPGRPLRKGVVGR